jgi:hypothetical protein
MSELSYELFSDGSSQTSELSKLRCYEVFSGGYIAFQRGIRFYFGLIANLSTFLSDNDSEDFLVDDEAEARVAELHAQQAETGSLLSKRAGTRWRDINCNSQALGAGTSQQ